MSEWAKITFGELFKTIYRYPTYFGIQYVDKGVIEIRGELLTANGMIADDFRFISSGTASKFPKVRLEEGDFVMSVRGTVGKIGRIKKEHEGAVITANLLRLSPDRAKAETGWLLQVLLSPKFLEQLENACSQTTIRTIQVSPLAKVRIDCPPLYEQRRIAEILSTLDETIEQTEALIAKYQQIKAGLMHDLFTRGVTADGKLRPTRAEAPQLYKESPLGWIPKEWEVASVTDCGSVQLGRQRSPDQMSGKWTTPYLRVANVFDGYIDYGDVLEMDFTPDERRTFSLKRGDILLNEGQSLELVGRCALFDGPDDEFCFQNTLVRFRGYDRQDSLFYRFLFKWFLDCGLFMRIAKQTTSVAHLGADRFARMRCISVPYEEQVRIADRVSKVQVRLDSESAHVFKLRQQKHGLMDDLLTGRVRVKVAD